MDITVHVFNMRKGSQKIFLKYKSYKWDLNPNLILNHFTSSDSQSVLVMKMKQKILTVTDAIITHTKKNFEMDHES